MSETKTENKGINFLCGEKKTKNINILGMGTGTGTAITKGKTPVPICSPKLSPVGWG